MNRHGVCHESLHPLHQVEPVEPTHSDIFALAKTTGMKIWNDDIVAQLFFIDTGQPEELCCTVAPTVYDKCRFLTAVAHKICMVALSRCHHKKRVAQCIDGSQTVHPLPGLRVIPELLLKTRILVCPVRVGSQGIVEQINAAPPYSNNSNAQYQGDDPNQYFLHIYKIGGWLERL